MKQVGTLSVYYYQKYNSGNYAGGTVIKAKKVTLLTVACVTEEEAISEATFFKDANQEIAGLYYLWVPAPTRLLP